MASLAVHKSFHLAGKVQPWSGQSRAHVLRGDRPCQIRKQSTLQHSSDPRNNERTKSLKMATHEHEFSTSRRVALSAANRCDTSHVSSSMRPTRSCSTVLAASGQDSLSTATTIPPSCEAAKRQTSSELAGWGLLRVRLAKSARTWISSDTLLPVAEHHQKGALAATHIDAGAAFCLTGEQSSRAATAKPITTQNMQNT